MNETIIKLIDKLIDAARTAESAQWENSEMNRPLHGEETRLKTSKTKLIKAIEAELEKAQS